MATQGPTSSHDKQKGTKRLTRAVNQRLAKLAGALETLQGEAALPTPVRHFLGQCRRM